MWNRMADLLGSIWASLPTSTEFWSAIIGAIVGAVVGGYISYRIQMRALRETRDQRREDHLRTQQGLANSLLFKVIRIYSDFYGIHRHIERCFESAAEAGSTDEPWQFVLPLANFPDPVHFVPDEMGMVLGLKDDEVFNRVIDLDVIHNSLVEATKVMSVERRSLGALLKPDESKGSTLSGTLDRESYFAVMPKMIEVNSLIDSIRTQAKRDAIEAHEAINRLHTLLKARLGLTYKITSKFAPPEAAPAAPQPP